MSSWRRILELGNHGRILWNMMQQKKKKKKKKKKNQKEVEK
ncbi:hypothetical protein HZ326_29084, partial [Fusarium oxysporum f. sp. albedinis]